MSIRLSFSGFVANIINPTRINIVTVLKKLGVPIHNSPSIQVLSVNPRQYSSAFGNPKAITKIILVCINFSLRDTVSNFTRELKTLSQLQIHR